MSRAHRPKLRPDPVEALAQRVATAERLRSKRPEREAISVPFSEFRHQVRRFRTSDLLEIVARLALVDEEGHELGTWSTYVAPWALALIARESILYGNDYRHTDVSDKGLAQILNAHGRIQEPGLQPTTESLLAAMTRLAYEQFPYQESIFEEVSRTHALLIEGPTQVGNLKVLNDPTAWETLLGAPLDQVVGATFFLQVAANKNNGWYDPSFLDIPALDALWEQWPRDVITQRINQLSLSYDGFKAAYANAPAVAAGDERFGFNPLIVSPFLRMPQGRYLAPQPRLILRTITPGALYYKGIARFDTPFAEDLGVLVEDYVGRQLKLAEPTATIVPEITYNAGKGKAANKSVDWFAIFPNLLVMVEVKSFRFTVLEKAVQPGHTAKSLEMLERATGQLEKSAAHIDDGTPEFTAIPADLPRIGIIVTSEPHYMANSDWTREQLKETSFPILVASLRDIEHLMSLPADEVASQLAHIASSEERTWLLGTALRTPKPLRNLILDEAWERYPWPKALDARHKGSSVDGVAPAPRGQTPGSTLPTTPSPPSHRSPATPGTSSTSYH